MKGVIRPSVHGGGVEGTPCGDHFDKINLRSANMAPVETVLKAVANVRRQRLLAWLKHPQKNFAPQKYGDLVKDGVCGIVIARKLRVSQPTASDHLNLLMRAGLLRSKRIKQWTYYKRDEAAISAAKRAISASF